MKTLATIAISILGFGLLLYALREYMPGALLILGGAAFVVAYIAKSVMEDPKAGWPRLAAFSTIGFLLTAFLSVAGSDQSAKFYWFLPLAAIFFFSLAIFCAVKWARLGRSSSGSGGGPRKFDAAAQASELSRAAELDRRRSEARGKMLHAQEEARQAQLKVSELEAANATLRQKLSRMENERIIPDPAAD